MNTRERDAIRLTDYTRASWYGAQHLMRRGAWLLVQMARTREPQNLRG
jgi:hypothetical protein